MSLSLQELENLKPEDLYIENPNQEQMWRDHLLYLLDYHPEWVNHLFNHDRKKLQRALLDNLQRASLLELILLKKNELAKDQVKEVVYAQVVSPSESLLPEKSLSDDLKLKILGWSDGLKLRDSESL
jgi:hypothetical protein